MYFLIKETLQECSKQELFNSEIQYVALLTSEEWKKERNRFDMGIDIEPDMADILSTNANVNYDSLTGAFCIPDRTDFSIEKKFAFALDEKGVVFIDDSGTAKQMILNIQQTRRWRLPGLERFLYDFLDQIIRKDFRIMENYERELDEIELAVMNKEEDLPPFRINEIRSDIRDLRIHYEQLLDLGEILEENENGFFQEENLRYFGLFSNRIERLRDNSASLKDFTMQIRDLHKSQLDIKQNHIMTLLTVVTTVFTPLTLITGWYGMNFYNMPELQTEWGYPAIIAISLGIATGCLLFFKKKKWL